MPPQYPWTPSGSDLKTTHIRIREGKTNRLGQGSPKIVATADSTPNVDTISWKRVERVSYVALDGRDTVLRFFLKAGEVIKLVREHAVLALQPGEIQLGITVPENHQFLVGTSNDADYMIDAEVNCYDPFFQHKAPQQDGVGRVLVESPGLYPPLGPVTAKAIGRPTIVFKTPRTAAIVFKAYDATYSTNPVEACGNCKIIFGKYHETDGTVQWFLGGDRETPLNLTDIIGDEFLDLTAGGGAPATFTNLGPGQDDWVLKYFLSTDTNKNNLLWLYGDGTTHSFTDPTATRMRWDTDQGNGPYATAWPIGGIYAGLRIIVKDGVFLNQWDEYINPAANEGEYWFAPPSTIAAWSDSGGVRPSFLFFTDVDDAVGVALAQVARGTPILTILTENGLEKEISYPISFPSNHPAVASVRTLLPQISAGIWIGEEYKITLQHSERRFYQPAEYWYFDSGFYNPAYSVDWFGDTDGTMWIAIQNYASGSAPLAITTELVELPVKALGIDGASDPDSIYNIITHVSPWLSPTTACPSDYTPV